jgi:predicted naringenin-chalcone synthase
MIGIILWSISATLIPGLLAHITAWLFLSAGLLAGAAAFWGLSRWRLYVIAVCAAYLLYVVPPLVSLSENGGPLNALSVVTQAVFIEGITAAKLLVYWHLVLMPIAVSLLILFLLFRSATGAWQK